MSTLEGLTKEQAEQKLTQNNQTLAALEEQSRKSKEAILRLAIGAGKGDSELLGLGFEQEMIDSIRNKSRREKNTEEIKKIIAEKAEETKKINEEQVENVKFEIEWQLKQKEKEEERTNAATTLGKKLRQVGLKEKDFESIPEWANLDEPQKMLVIEQASQQIFVDVKKEGEKRFNEKNKINASILPWKWRPSVLKKVWKHLGKSYYVNKQSKEALEDFRTGELKPDQEVLQALTKRMSELDLKVVDKAGKPSIEFIHIDPAMSPEVKAAVEKYNEKANEFSKMPDSWKNERAAKGLGSEKNYDTYILAEHEYNEAKKKVIDLRAKKYKDEGIEASLAVQKAQTYMCDKDYKIAMMQFTNTSPDAILEMEKLQGSSSWKKLLNNENGWRASYMGLGYAGRWALSGFATLAGPITAATIGGWRAKRKAEQKINRAFGEGREGKTFREMTLEEKREIREKYSKNFKKDANGNVMLDKEGTPIMLDGKPYKPGQIFEDKNDNKNLLTKVVSGKDVNAREVAGFIDADSQIQRLENILNKIAGSTNLGEKARLILELERRSDYVRSKLEEGLINYGTNNPVGTNYEMLRLLSKAAVEIQANRPNLADIPDELIDIKVMSIDGSSRMEKRQLRDLIREENKDVALILERMQQKNAIGFDEKQLAFKKQEIIRGALVAASFSGLAYEIRDLQERFGLTINFGNLFGGNNHEKVAGAAGMIKANGGETLPTNIADSSNLNTPTNLQDSIPPTPKAADSLTVDVSDQPSVTKPEEVIKTEEAPKVEEVIKTTPAPKITEEKIIQTPKAPVIEDTLKTTPTNIDVNNGSVIDTPKAPEIFDESALKNNEMIESPELEGKVNSTVINTPEAPVIVDEGINTPTAPVVDAPKVDNIPNPDNNFEQKNIDIINEKLKDVKPPVVVDENIRPTQNGGFNNESIGSGKVIKPTENVGGYNTGEEKGNIYPRTGAVRGGPNPESISREVPMTDREAIFTNKGENVFENNVDNSVNENLPIESDPKHFETAREIRETFGSKTVMIDRAEYPTLDQTEDGVNYNDWNTANDNMFEQKGLEFDSYEDFNKERELQELFGVNNHTNEPAKIIYDNALGKNVEIPKHVSITQEYFRDMPTWKIVEKIPAKYFMQEDFLNGNNLSQENLDALVSKGIIKQNPLTGTYTFSQRSEIERLSSAYKKLVSSRDYEKFIDKVEHKLGNDKPIGNENIETYIKRLTAKIYKADDNTLFGFKRPVDWDDRDSWNRDYDGDSPSQDRMTRPISPTRRVYNSGGENPISPTRGIYER